jgi:hypothetical protein
VTVRKLFLTAAAFGLMASVPALAQTKMSPPLPTTSSMSENQELADKVAAKLRSSGVMKGAKINIETSGGTVILAGTVIDEKQHLSILRTVKEVSGIKRIESEIEVAAAATEAAPLLRAGGQESPLAAPGGFAPIGQPQPRVVAGPVAAPGVVPPGIGNDPIPLNGGPMMGPLDAAGPKLPPHAWPTYAPYNNYSRVAYPSAYPYNAFPYIGPFYPFPKVPLGWRKVTLEWDDGHWYLGRLSTPKDYWRVKFW